MVGGYMMLIIKCFYAHQNGFKVESKCASIRSDKAHSAEKWMVQTPATSSLFSCHKLMYEVRSQTTHTEYNSIGHPEYLITAIEQRVVAPVSIIIIIIISMTAKTNKNFSFCPVYVCVRICVTYGMTFNPNVRVQWIQS